MAKQGATERARRFFARTETDLELPRFFHLKHMYFRITNQPPRPVSCDPPAALAKELDFITLFARPKLMARVGAED